MWRDAPFNILGTKNRWVVIVLWRPNLLAMDMSFEYIVKTYVVCSSNLTVLLPSIHPLRSSSITSETYYNSFPFLQTYKSKFLCSSKFGISKTWPRLLGNLEFCKTQDNFQKICLYFLIGGSSFYGCRLSWEFMKKITSEKPLVFTFQKNMK